MSNIARATALSKVQRIQESEYIRPLGSDPTGVPEWPVDGHASRTAMPGRVQSSESRQLVTADIISSTASPPSADASAPPAESSVFQAARGRTPAGVDVASTLPFRGHELASCEQDEIAPRRSLYANVSVDSSQSFPFR
jgi:hypothetical protein